MFIHSLSEHSMLSGVELEWTNPKYGKSNRWHWLMKLVSSNLDCEDKYRYMLDSIR